MESKIGANCDPAATVAHELVGLVLAAAAAAAAAAFLTCCARACARWARGRASEYKDYKSAFVIFVQRRLQNT
jgi:hypothetical protein